MGYESKLYIVERTEFKGRDGKIFHVHGLTIAMFDLCKMCWDSKKIFAEPIDFPIDYDSETGDPIYEDLYGNHCGMTDIDTVVNALESIIKSGDPYRRLAPAVGLLKGFDKSQWHDLRVVHYGH